MGEIFKSKRESAEENINQIELKKNSISNPYIVGGCRTNLSVIGNCQDAINCILEINSKYIDLLSKDATAIADLCDTYERFDSELSECMGIE